MKQFVTINLNWDLTLVLPLEKSIQILELLNNPEVWFESNYNGSDDHVEADQGRSLVQRKIGSIETKIVPASELNEMIRKGGAEQVRRDRRNAERAAEREAKRLAEIA